MTAKESQPEWLMVARQNRQANTPLFKRFGARMTMQPSHSVAHELLPPRNLNVLTYLRTGQEGTKDNS